MSQLKVVFAGTPEFGCGCLDALAAHHQLIAVYTQPDRPAGRGRKLQVSAVKAWALEHDTPVFQPLNFKTPEAVADLAALKPDVLVVIAYGLILPLSVLTIPRLGCINVHASLLPRWRGASPIQQAILHGDKESGVTIMQMDVGMDTGDMLATVSCKLESQETAASLHDKLSQMAVTPLLETLDKLASGSVIPVVQDENLVTMAGKIRKDDAKINWQQPAEVIDRLIRAFNPWPIAFTQMGDDIIRVHQAVVKPMITNALPGTILAIDKTGVQVAAMSNSLLIQQLQFAGGKVISASDLLNSGRAATLVNQVFK